MDFTRKYFLVEKKTFRRSLKFKSMNCKFLGTIVFIQLSGNAFVYNNNNNILLSLKKNIVSPSMFSKRAPIPYNEHLQFTQF